MSSYPQVFLQDSSGAAPAIYLAAFGKHPGWNDHIDDFGVETETLALAKQLIYTQGLASQIDAAAWDELPPEKKLAGFNHQLLWVRGSNFIAGVIWSSQDGKGRAKYPMVLCVQATNVPASWTVAHVYPVLDDLKAACQATSSADEVVRLLTAGRQRLRSALAGLTAGASASGSGAPPFGSRTGLHRVLYEMSSQMQPFSPGRVDARSVGSSLSRRLRVPAKPADAAALGEWMRLLSSQLDAGVPLLGLAARDASWIDFLAGQPTPQDFFCLRAHTSQLPLTTDIPYTLEPTFIATADEIVDEFAAGRDSGRTIFGERPRGGFTLFPWSGATKDLRSPAEPRNGGGTQTSEPPPLVVASHSSSLLWVKVVFILLGLSITALTIYFASHRG